MGFKTFITDLASRFKAYLITYQKGTKKIKVDKERFVDVSLSFKDICTNFNFKLTKDDNVIGLQRRYDDESKRRAVQVRVGADR